MIARHPTHRTGIALLIVLSTVVAVSAAAVALARRDVSTRAGLRARSLHLRAAGLLRASDAPILDWLARESRGLVLPPDAPSAGVLVLDDQWWADRQQYRIRIEAWDQCGVPTLASVQADPRLGSHLPARLAALVSEWDRPIPTGLDELSPMARAANLALFPSLRDPAPSMGEFVGIGPPARSRSLAAINIHTAPSSVLHAACAIAGRVDAMEILEARARGDRTMSPPRNSPHTGVTLVGESSLWSFRVDIRVGTVECSWWCSYAYTGSRWELRQRCMINE